MIKNRIVFKKLLGEKKIEKASVLLGARQVGKTTTLQYLHAALCAQEGSRGLFLDLDIYSNYEKVATYENAINTCALSGYREDSKEKFYLFLDEFQRYRDLSLVIKNICDHHKNIKLYLSGSSSLAIKHKIQETLAGRKIVSEIYPLCFEEYLTFRGREDLLNSCRQTNAIQGGSLFDVTRDLYGALEEFLVYGGYPEIALTRDHRRKKEVLNGIFDLYVKKELIEYLKVEKIRETKKIIEYLAVNNAHKIQYQDIAQIAGLSQKTVKDYVELLQETFLIVEVRPFFTNKNKEIVKIPKIYFVDTGVRNYFVNNFNGMDIRQDAPFLFENYLVSEWLKKGVKGDAIKFWQDKNQREVDFVLSPGPACHGVEVKYKKELKRDDFIGLNAFQKMYPSSKLSLVNLGVQKKTGKVKLLLPYRACSADR